MAADVLQFFSYIAANVSDDVFRNDLLLVMITLIIAITTCSHRKLYQPTAYRMQCHSCMSPYLEDQFVYISHLYKKPLSFTDKCDKQTFDYRHVKFKNCTDWCITLRMNDKVGGRRRNGYMRGCMSDIKFYNRSVLYYGDVIRTGYSPQQSRCQLVRLRDLFASPDWYGFDSNDHVELCTCHSPMCNGSAAGSTRAANWWMAAWATMLCIAAMWPNR